MWRRRTTGLLLAPGLAVLALVFLYPVAVTLVAAPAGVDDGGLADRLGALAADDHIWRAAARTVRVAALVTGLCLLLGLPVGFLISRGPPRRRAVLLALAVFPLLLSTVVRTYSWLVILGRTGLLSRALTGLGLAERPTQLLYTETAVVVGLTQLFTPLVIITAYGAFAHVHPDLEAAARGLGASAGSAFRRVALPLALPGVLVGATLVFAGAVTAFTTPLLLGGTRTPTLATLLYDYANVTVDWSSAAAVALLMTVIVLAAGALAARAPAKAAPS
ncbi:ABC transporter permease [Nonomuraea montanisoli]|uniref:ABC transporter permease n=1 Tax=Nonomuraea montanisoli TaxID=2741721 RepID=UPI001F1E5557|nr:ABC transporter permease [Nonomuraea montanisoli]